MKDRIKVALFVIAIVIIVLGKILLAARLG